MLANKSMSGEEKVEEAEEAEVEGGIVRMRTPSTTEEKQSYDRNTQFKGPRPRSRIKERVHVIRRKSTIGHVDRKQPVFLDHYSLPSNSSAINFQSGNTYVYSQGGGSQLILEERLALKRDIETASRLSQCLRRVGGGSGQRGAGPPMQSQNGEFDDIATARATAMNFSQEFGSSADSRGDGNYLSKQDPQIYITAKTASHATPGLIFIRAMYSCIALFLPGFLFILSCGLILFLFADLVDIMRAGLGEGVLYKVFGLLFSLPILMDGLPFIVVLATMFVVDIFKGSPLIISFGWGRVFTSWITFVAFIVTPLIAFICAAMLRSDKIIEVIMLAGFASISLFFCAFAVSLSYFRIHSCLHLVQERNNAQGNMGVIAKVASAILLAARHYASGRRDDLYIHECDSHDLKQPSGTYNQTTFNEGFLYATSGKRYIWLTSLPMFNFAFERLEVPQRIMTQNEIDGNLPFFTKSTWSLEHGFCRSRKQGVVMMIGGPSAMSQKEIQSSVICYFICVCFYLLSMVAIVAWYEAPLAIIGIVTALFVCFWAKNIWRAIRLSRMMTDYTRKYQDDDSEGKDIALVQKWESYIITRPTERFTKFCLFLFFVCFGCFPTIYLLTSGNVPGMIVFIVIFFLHIEKRYLTASPIIEQLGSYGTLGTAKGSMLEYEGLLGSTSKSEWQHKSRLFNLEKMSHGNISQIWSGGLRAALYLFAIVAIGAALTSETTNDSFDPDEWINFPSNATYYYQEHQPGQPMCRLEDRPHNEKLLGIQYLADFSFLSVMPYFPKETIQPMLDTWFGNDEAKLVEDALLNFRTKFPEFTQSSASYELVSFPKTSTAAVSVRGTMNFFDYYADAKLWYSSMLFQLYRQIIPLGHQFNPLIRFCINTLSFLETANIKRVAYYIETTKFVDELKQAKKHDHIVITGHSLGGGVALITGAQAHINAVGLSAPNTVLGRGTVTPQVTNEELKKYTLNIVPERDIFPMIGDHSRQIEHIECRAGVNTSPLNCHDFIRALCEMLYSCGSVERPVPCECVTKYAFPEPVQITGTPKSLAEACHTSASLV